MNIKDLLNEAKKTIDYKNLVRFIPTGSKVYTKPLVKGLEITIVNQTSAPPLVAKAVVEMERRLLNDVGNFINDVEEVIKLKKVNKDKYTFVSGVKGGVNLTYTFTLAVGSVVEEKKLQKLDDALESFKKYILPKGE